MKSLGEGVCLRTNLRIIVLLAVSVASCAGGDDDADSPPGAKTDASQFPVPRSDAAIPQGVQDARPAGNETPDTSAMLECAGSGKACSVSVACCMGSTCVVDRATGISVCAANCTMPSHCNSGCCAPLANTAGRVCGPASLCFQPPPPPPVVSPAPSGCGRLVLVAKDGVFLGVLTGNEFATDGVCNQFSRFGSQFSSTSIFNPFGKYGGEFSTESAYNKFTTTPPLAICETPAKGQFSVTKNEFVVGVKIDPDLLCAALSNAGI